MIPNATASGAGTETSKKENLNIKNSFVCWNTKVLNLFLFFRKMYNKLNCNLNELWFNEIVILLLEKSLDGLEKEENCFTRIFDNHPFNMYYSFWNNLHICYISFFKYVNICRNVNAHFVKIWFKMWKKNIKIFSYKLKCKYNEEDFLFWLTKTIRL